MIKKVLTIGYKTYRPMFKDGDKVTAKHYHNVMYVEGIDELMTETTGKLCYRLCDVKYALGKAKVSNAESFPEDELTLYTGKALY